MTHALAYRRHAAYKLVACVDPDARVRSEFAARWTVPAVFASLDEAMAAARYDIASVCSPTGTQLDVLERLLETDIRCVFAEKPLDGKPDRARQLAGRYAAKGRALAVNYTRRWDPELGNLRDEIASGKWGAFRSAVGWYSRGVINNGSHLVDLISLLTQRSMQIAHIGPSYNDGVAGDPTVDAVLDAEGVPVHLVGCDGRDHSRFELTLSFERGVVEILEGGLFVRRRPLVGWPIFPHVSIASDAPRTETGYGVALVRALDEIAAWKPGQRLSSDADSAIAAIELADQIRARASSRVSK